MNLFERLERLRHLLVSTEHDEDPRDVSISLNRRLFDKPLIGMMASMAAQQASAARSLAGMGEQPPTPTKKWIAVVGRFWADSDDAEDAVSELEIKALRTIKSGLDAKIGNLRHALSKSEEIAKVIASTVDGVPSGGGTSQRQGTENTGEKGR